MGERLGDYLVQHGIVTEEQLSTVLERQVMMGGRLGTNLIELGYIGEDELVQFLSQKLKIPSAQPQDFETIQPDAIRLVPANMAQKYGAIPLSLERKILRVAMVNPVDVEAITQLGFVAGCSIKPCVASEARVQYALERYYHIARDLRYLSILTDDRKTKPAQKSRTRTTKAMGEDALLQEFEELKERLVQASDRDEVIQGVSEFMLACMDRDLFLVVNEGHLVGWSGHVPGLNDASIRKIRISLSEPSLFSEAVEKKAWLTAEGPVLDELGDDRPSFVAVLPMVLEGVVIGVVYVDDALKHCPPARTELLPKAVEKAAMALKILILKTKLLKI